MFKYVININIFALLWVNVSLLYTRTI